MVAETSADTRLLTVITNRPQSSCFFDTYSRKSYSQARREELDVNRDEQIATSKFLSYVLRHAPDSIGLELDEAGWVSVDRLLSRMADSGRMLRRSDLEVVVRESEKQRFALSEDGESIRANQGHSIPVELGYEPASPPPVLFHGTVPRFLAAIESSGLRAMNRHHVHLSVDTETASAVGSRRGKPVLVSVDAGAMHEAGHIFYVTPNGVWLTEFVPPEFLRETE